MPWDRRAPERAGPVSAWSLLPEDFTAFEICTLCYLPLDSQCNHSVVKTYILTSLLRRLRSAI